MTWNFRWRGTFYFSLLKNQNINELITLALTLALFLIYILLIFGTPES